MPTPPTATAVTHSRTTQSARLPAAGVTATGTPNGPKSKPPVTPSTPTTSSTEREAGTTPRPRSNSSSDARGGPHDPPPLPRPRAGDGGVARDPAGHRHRLDDRPPHHHPHPQARQQRHLTGAHRT